MTTKPNDAKPSERIFDGMPHCRTETGPVMTNHQLTAAVWRISAILDEQHAVEQWERTLGCVQCGYALEVAKGPLCISCATGGEFIQPEEAAEPKPIERWQTTQAYRDQQADKIVANIEKQVDPVRAAVVAEAKPATPQARRRATEALLRSAVKPRISAKHFALELNARIARVATAFDQPGQEGHATGARYILGVVDALLSDYDTRDMTDFTGNAATAAEPPLPVAGEPSGDALGFWKTQAHQFELLLNSATEANGLLTEEKSEISALYNNLEKADRAVRAERDTLKSRLTTAHSLIRQANALIKKVEAERDEREREAGVVWADVQRLESALAEANARAERLEAALLSVQDLSFARLSGQSVTAPPAIWQHDMREIERISRAARKAAASSQLLQDAQPVEGVAIRDAT